MKLFTFPAFHHLAGELAAGASTVELGECRVERHANGELWIELQSAVEGVDCAALGTLQPPDRDLAEFLLLCDTLRRAGARSVLAILPYFAYARQDRYEPRCSLAAAWVGALLAASGVTQVLTLDVHSPHVAPLLPIPLRSQGSAALFARALAGRLVGATLVAPDEGAIERCAQLRQATGLELPTAHFHKVRSKAGVRARLVGAVSERAVVFDDILDTGGTLVACAEALHTAGARQISVGVTHGLFTGTAWQRLWSLGVDRLVCTDSVGTRPTADARVEVIACAPALLPGLRALSELFEAVA